MASSTSTATNSSSSTTTTTTTTTTSSNVSFSCAECPSATNFRTAEELEIHITADHLNYFPYECERCRFAKFPTEFALRSHWKRDHSQNDYYVRYKVTDETDRKSKQIREILLRCLRHENGVASAVEPPKKKKEEAEEEEEEEEVADEREEDVDDGDDEEENEADEEEFASPSPPKKARQSPDPPSRAVISQPQPVVLNVPQPAIQHHHNQSAVSTAAAVAAAFMAAAGVRQNGFGLTRHEEPVEVVNVSSVSSGGGRSSDENDEPEPESSSRLNNHHHHHHHHHLGSMATTSTAALDQSVMLSQLAQAAQFITPSMFEATTAAAAAASVGFTPNAGNAAGAGGRRVNRQVREDGTVREMAICQLCNAEVTNQRSSLVYHANVKHLQKNMYECKKCGKTWHTIAKSDVIKHVRALHGGDEDVFEDNRPLYLNEMRQMMALCFPRTTPLPGSGGSSGGSGGHGSGGSHDDLPSTVAAGLGASLLDESPLLTDSPSLTAQLMFAAGLLRPDVKCDGSGL